MQSAAGGPQNHSWMRLIGRSPGFPKTRGSFRRSISERAGQCFGGSLGPSCSGKLRAVWKSSLWSTTGAGRGIGVIAFRCTNSAGGPRGDPACPALSGRYFAVNFVQAREFVSRRISFRQANSDSLSRFIGAYARLAKLPRPQLQPLFVADCVGRAVSFETRLPVQVESGPNFTLQGDPDQLEQVLINLLRNAADASLSTQGRVTVGWQRDTMVEIWIKDEGPGLSSTANLFVPFFTTKPGGSGIWLVVRN